MQTISSTGGKPLEFNPAVGEVSRDVIAPTERVAWLHTLADEPGARFDIKIKDALGRVKFEKNNCGTDHKAFGELINMPTTVGEKLNVSIENLKGAKKLNVFIN